MTHQVEVLGKIYRVTTDKEACWRAGVIAVEKIGVLREGDLICINLFKNKLPFRRIYTKECVIDYEAGSK